MSFFLKYVEDCHAPRYLITPQYDWTWQKYNPMSYEPERNNELKFIGIDEAIENIKRIAGEGVVLFLGAGISVAPPSNCPAWNDFLELALLSAQKTHASLSRYCDLVKPQLSGVKPELLCQILYNNLLGDFFGFLDILLMGHPNANHYCIAQMTREYAIPVILTTNFDVHIENTFYMTGSKIGLHVCSSPRDLRKKMKSRTNRKSETQVIKIHGSLDDRTSIVLTIRQAGLKLKENIADIIRNALASYTVIVVGYSGNDDDIFPIFMENALKAKKVFWVLWDNKKSITNNIEMFARECSNCTLVTADKVSIFERLVNHHESTATGINDVLSHQSEFLQRWAAGVTEHIWMNFFSELLLVMNSGDNVARFIADESENIIRTATDQWTITKALKNRALALIGLKDYEGAQTAMSKAAENYMIWGRHREVIECLSIMIAKIPMKTKWRGNDDPLFWCAHLSGKSFDPYDLGLYNYAAGIYFLREQRLDIAQSHLFIAGGYAKRSGDSVTLIRCLEGLGELLRLKGDNERERLCHNEITRINSTLGLYQSNLAVGERQIITECENAARINFNKLIIGEAILVAISSLVIGAIACIFIHDFWSRVGTFISLLLTGAAVKIWNAKKRFIKYRHIERS